MNKKGGALKRLVALMLALTLVIGAVPLGALNSINVAYAEGTEKHELEFIDVSPEEKENYVSFGEDTSGSHDYLLNYNSLNERFTISAKAADEADKVWLVIKTSMLNGQVVRYTVNEVSSDRDNPTSFSWVYNTNGDVVYVCVGQKEPEVDKTTDKKVHSINFNEDVNTVYTLGSNEVESFLTGIEIKNTSTGQICETIPAFDKNVYEYEVYAPCAAEKIQFTHQGAMVVYYMDGNPLWNGSACSPGFRNLAHGTNVNLWDDDGKIEMILKTYNIKGEDVGKEYKFTLRPAFPSVYMENRSYNVSSGKTAELSVEAYNAEQGELSYQWYKNSQWSNEGGTLVEGATESKYTPPAVDLGNSLINQADYYYCIVTNTVEGKKYDVVSDVAAIGTNAVLDVKIANADGSQMPEEGYEYYYGEESSFEAPTLTVEFDESAGGGDGQWSYEWIENYVTVGTEKNFTIPVKTEEKEGSYTYQCRVKYTSGDTSNVFLSDKVTVNKINLNLSPVVSITTQPQSAQYVCGQSSLKTLSVGASVSGGSGKDGFRYQWQISEDGVNFADIPDYIYETNINGMKLKSAKNSSYQLEQDNKDAYYRCKVIGLSTNMKGQVFESEPAYSEAAHITYTPVDMNLEGGGTSDNPYLIQNIGDLEAVRDKVNNDGNEFNNIYFKITADITLPDGWEPIGSSGHKFCGNIDGAKDDGTNHLLTVAEGGLPLLGHTKGATLCNLDIYGKKIAGYGVVNNYQIGNTIAIENVNLKSGTHTLMSGYIGGYASGVNEITIRNCTVEEGVVIGDDGSWGDLGDTTYTYNFVGEFNHQDIIGSFAGAFNGYMENCVSYATVYGRNKVGGLIGMKGQSMGYCSITNCEFYGDVKASGECAGGIIASGYDASSAPATPCVTIKNCAVYGTVSGKDYVGGIFGGEMRCLQCWDNGIGYIQDNYFGGTIISEGSNVGGIIGYMASLDKYNIIENNYFKEGCGATRGIGSVHLVDTDCETADKSDANVKYDNTEKYHRTDDPLGADKDKLTKSSSAADVASGKVTAALNGREGSFGNWAQGQENYPVHGDEAVAYKISTRDAKAYGYQCFRGENIDLSGIEFEITFTDGSTKTIDGSELKVMGYDKNTLGSQQVTLSYGAATQVMRVTVIKRDVGNIKVKFSLLGDTKHGPDSDEVHTLIDGNLIEWIPETEYEVDGNSTVLDVFTMALEEHGMTFENPDPGNYVESITNGDITLGEIENGKNSGWMYTLNGVHVLLGVKEQYLEDGDEIVFHYTDDYQRENWGQGKTVDDVIEMIEALPETDSLTLENEEEVAAAYSAYMALSDEEKSEISEEIKTKLNEAVLKIAELKKADIAELEEAYKKTTEYLSDLADQYTIQVGSIGGEWLALGLARAGEMTEEQAEAYYKNVCDYVKENINDKEQLHRSKSTENSRVILGLTAIGKDVTDVAGHNLLKGLSNLDYLKKQGINGPIWALIALDSHDYEIPAATEGTQATRENIIATILEAQLEDGGWAIVEGGSDPDMTAMAVQALAPYYNTNPEVKAAVDKALECLSGMQNADGGYMSFGASNSESCAQVVVALTALGIDPVTDARFVKNGNSVVDALLSFYVEGGGFKHISSGEVNGMATEQGYYALVAYNRMLEMKTSLYDMSDVTIGESEVPITPEDPAKDPDAIKTGTGEVSKTGDDMNVMPWAMAILMAGAGMLIFRRKEDKDEAA